MDEIASVTPSYGGVGHVRLDGDEVAGRGLQWPCPHAGHPGTPILHRHEFAQGVGAFSTPDYRPSAELPDEEYPLAMMTGRVLAQYNACAMTGRTEGLDALSGSSFIELNACRRRRPRHRRRRPRARDVAPRLPRDHGPCVGQD